MARNCTALSDKSSSNFSPFIRNYNKEFPKFRLNVHNKTVFTAKSLGGIKFRHNKITRKVRFLNNLGMRETLITQKPKARHIHAHTPDKFVIKKTKK